MGRSLIGILLVSLLCGCNTQGVQQRSPGDSATAGTGRRVIGVSVLTLTNPFFKEIADTITADAAKHGFSTIVVAGERDAARQQAQVDDFLERGCAAIVLCPSDSRAVGTAIAKCNGAGVPVFTADIASLAEGPKVVTHIATDNFAGGKQAGEAMIEALGKAGGKVVIIDFKQAESCILRVKGFKEVIDAHNEAHPHAPIEIVSELPGEGAKDLGFKAAEDALQAHPDLAGIFAINDPSALGARAAVEKAEKARQVKIIGFDGQIDGKQAIKEGKIYADPIQFPDRIGSMTVDCIVRYFDGEKLPAEQLIPTALYRQADGAKDPLLKQDTMMRKWLNEYGMALVLLALCAFFTATTWSAQQRSGRDAGWTLAEGIPPNSRVIIVAPTSNEGEVFAEALIERAKEKQVEVVATVAGEPFEVLSELEAMSNKKFDILAVHPTAYHWTIYDRLAEKHESFKESTIMAAAPRRGSTFLSRSNLLNIANQIAVIAIIAIGMTMIIITGGIDLSVGSLVALSAVVTTWLVREYGGGTTATAGALLLCGFGGMAACGAMGAFSGFMVTRFRIPAFIVTLSVMLIARGLAERISENQSINQVPDSFVWLGVGTMLPGVPNAVILAVALYIIAHIVMTRTVFGRYIYAVGGNLKAAWLSGLPVNRVLLAVYTIGGLLAGLAGVVLASQLKSGAATYGQMYEMYVIAAVVVGGTSLLGGEGRIFNTLVGALIIAVIQNGMNLLGLESSLQRMVLGGMILSAVVLDSLQRSKGGRFA